MVDDDGVSMSGGKAVETVGLAMPVARGLEAGCRRVRCRGRGAEGRDVGSRTQRMAQGA